jgi:heat shock protein HspQ
MASSASSSKERQDNFSKDIKTLLGPVVMDIDKNMIATQQSQQDLGQEIERLVAGKLFFFYHCTLLIDQSIDILYYVELEVFTDIAEPPKLQSALDKLMDAKKKLALSTKLLQQTHTRMERLENLLGK